MSNIGAVVLSEEMCGSGEMITFRVDFFKCEKDVYSLERLREHVAANDDGLGLNDDDDGYGGGGGGNGNAVEELLDQCGKIPAYDDEWKFNEVSVETG